MRPPMTDDALSGSILDKINDHCHPHGDVREKNSRLCRNPGGAYQDHCDCSLDHCNALGAILRGHLTTDSLQLRLVAAS